MTLPSLPSMPTLLTNQRMQGFVTNTRVALDEARTEAVTGLAADRAEKVGGDIGRLRGIEKLLDDNEQRLIGIAQFEADARIVQNALGFAREAISGLGVELETAANLRDDEAVQAITTQARATLESLFGQLNSPHAGNYLFSGAASDTPPLVDVDTFLTDIAPQISGLGVGNVNTNLDTYFTDPAGGFLTNIYQGSTTADAATREVSQARRLGVDTRVDDPAIRDTIRNLAVVVLVGESSLSPSVKEDMLVDAAQRLNGSVSALIDEQTKLGAKEAEAALLEARHNATRLVLEEQMLGLIGVDAFEAASRTTELETQLQAAFLTTARIQQLSLVNFI